MMSDLPTTSHRMPRNAWQRRRPGDWSGCGSPTCICWEATVRRC